MSFNWIDGAMKAKTGHYLRHSILLHLADMANNKGQCWPSYSRLAEDVECSRRSVVNHMGQLVKDGWLQKKARFNKGNKTSNLYQLSEKILHLASARDAPPSARDAPPSAPAALRVVSEVHIEPVIEPVSEPIQGKTSRFVPPCVEEVQNYLDARGITTFTGQEFVDFYSTGNWHRGKTKIKNWKACVNTWVKRSPEPEKEWVYEV